MAKIEFDARPLSDEELEFVRRESAVPRLLATIDSLKAQQEAVVVSPAKGALGRVLHKADGVMVCHVTLEPGAEWPEETHSDHSETILRTRGALRVTFDSHPMHLSEHCFSYVEAGEAHHVRNASTTEPAEYISVLRRA